MRTKGELKKKHVNYNFENIYRLSFKSTIQNESTVSLRSFTSEIST